MNPFEGFKGTLSGPKQFLATESALQIMKNAFYFILKALYVLSFIKYLGFRPEFFGYVEKPLDKKAKVDFKIYDVINW